MGYDKGHKEFHGVDMKEGFHAVPGYPWGFSEKILAGSLDEKNKVGNRTRILKIEPGDGEARRALDERDPCCRAEVTRPAAGRRIAEPHPAPGDHHRDGDAELEALWPIKRFPVLASLSISGVRSIVVNLGVYAHFSLAFGDTVSIPAPVWALTVLMFVWLVLFVTACRWWTPHPKRVPLLAVAAQQRRYR